MVATLSCEREARGPKDCEQKVAAFRQWLSDLVDEGYGGWHGLSSGVSHVDVGDHPAARRPDRSMVLIIMARDAIMINNRNVADPAALMAPPAPLIAELRTEQGRYGPIPVELEIDQVIPWRAVVAVVDAVRRSGTNEVTIRVIGRTRQRAPRLSTRMQTVIARMSEEDATLTTLANLAYERCRPAAEIAAKQPPSGSYGSPEFEAWLRRLLTSLPAAVAACRCDVNLEEARAFHWYAAGRDEQPNIVAGIHLRLSSPDSADSTISLPSDARWGEAYKEVLDTDPAGSVALAVAP